MGAVPTTLIATFLSKFLQVMGRHCLASYTPLPVAVPKGHGIESWIHFLNQTQGCKKKLSDCSLVSLPTKTALLRWLEAEQLGLPSYKDHSPQVVRGRAPSSCLCKAFLSQTSAELKKTFLSHQMPIAHVRHSSGRARCCSPKVP